MFSEEIKKEFKNKDLAEFYGLSRNTITNYLRDLDQLEQFKLIPPTGKQNIIKALAFYYKFNNCEDDNSLLEIMQSNIEFLEENVLDLEKKEQFKEDHFKSLKNSILKCVTNIKENLKF